MRTSTDPRLLFGAAVWLALGCAGGPSTQAPEPARDAVEATVLVYSGRPNPVFRLDAAAMARLAELLRATEPQPAFERATVIPSRLGYQGVRLVNAGALGGLPAEMLVHGQDIEVHDAEKRFLIDRTTSIERFVLEQALAQKAITQEMLDRIRRG